MKFQLPVLKNPFKGLSDLMAKSVEDNSNVSSLRIQAYMAFWTVFGVWAIANLTSLVITTIEYYKTMSSTRGKFDFDLIGWVEIVSLTGGMILGRVWQTQIENKKVG